MKIRAENESDREAVRAVNVSAFETSAEADLVEALRKQAEPVISLVAEDDGQVIGHIMFSPVLHSEYGNLKMMGLAPMAVVPDRQREGVGSTLVRQGLENCRQLGYSAVVVLGHPEYYPRFGFVPSTRFGIDSEYEVPKEVFMAMELEPGALKGRSGRVQYHAAFGDVKRFIE